VGAPHFAEKIVRFAFSNKSRLIVGKQKFYMENLVGPCSNLTKVSDTEVVPGVFTICYKITPTIPEEFFNSCYPNHTLTGQTDFISPRKSQRKHRLKACRKCTKDKSRCPFSHHFFEDSQLPPHVWRLDLSGKPEGPSYAKHSGVENSYEGPTEVTQNFITEVPFRHTDGNFQNLAGGVEMGAFKGTENTVRDPNMVSETVVGETPSEIELMKRIYPNLELDIPEPPGGWYVFR
jgi:hypothetical protein